MEPAKNVGIWIRVSTEDQVKGESPEHHERRARYYAESKGWTVGEVYRLEAVSGKSVMEHPETQRMLADVRSHKIGGIIFSKLARLARNTRELLDFADIFRDCNADLVSLQEAIDTSTPAGRLFYTMIAAMAQWEREEIAERVAASVPVRAKLGKPLGGQAPFGYRWVDRKLVPHPKEAPIRKLVYELFLEHRRKLRVAKALNRAGLRSRSGRPFSAQNISWLLRDPVAKGLRRANYTVQTGNGKRVSLKPKTEWIFTKVEPVVSTDVWDRCNEILDEQEQRRKRPARPAVNLFSGYTYCSCGAKMYVPSNSPKYTCRRCRMKIPTVDLEAVFREQLKSFVFSEQEIANHLSGAGRIVQEKETLLASLEQNRDQVKTELEKLYRLYIEGEIPSHGYGEKFRPLDERLHQIEDDIPTVQAEIDFLKIERLSSQEIVSQARDLFSRWTKLEAAEKRSIVETITERITIRKDEVSIHLAYNPHHAEKVSKSSRTLSRSLLLHAPSRSEHCGKCSARETSPERPQISRPCCSELQGYCRLPAAVSTRRARKKSERCTPCGREFIRCITRDG